MNDGIGYNALVAADTQPVTDRSYAARSRLLRFALLAGIAGPSTLGSVIVGLSIVQYRFMRGLGWHPMDAPTTDWPSGLALGPYGALMVAAFVVSGLLLVCFGLAVHEALPTLKGGPVFLAMAGVGMMLLASKTDPTFRTTPATIHGMMHDIAFVIMGLSFVCAFVAFGIGMLRIPGWRIFARYSLVSALIVVPGIAIKGLFFYVFLLNTLVWVTQIARKLRQTTRHGTRS